MEKSVILSHDLGTSAVKSSLVSADGSLVGSCSSPIPTASNGAYGREQDPELWWSGVVANTRRLVADHEDEWIAAIGVSGHMLGLVLVDDSGEPVMRAMIHSDTRARVEAEEIRRAVGDASYYETTGNRLDARSSLCKLLWARRNRPEAYGRARRVLQCKDFIVGRLVGAYETTDYSDASHASFLDVSRGEFAGELLATLGLDRGLFPDVRNGTDQAGTLCSAAAGELGLPTGTPVAVGAGDGSCAGVGAGAVEPGASYCCMGTTGWIAVCGGEPVRDPGQRVFNIMSAGGPSCDWFGTVQSAGASMSWCMTALGLEDFAEVEALVEATEAGSGGVLFLPYLEGERSPIWDASARGVWFGLSSLHSTGHLVRSVFEGVAFALRSVLDVMREHVAVDSLGFIGGGFRSALWRQIIADVLEVPLASVSVRAEDATALGAALTAGVSVGLYRDLLEATNRIPRGAEVAPRSLGDVYRRGFERYQSLYPALREQFARAEEGLGTSP